MGKALIAYRIVPYNPQYIVIIPSHDHNLLYWDINDTVAW